MTQFILLGALALLVVQVVLISPRQIRDQEQKAETAVKTPAAGADGQTVDQSMKGMHMIETREGRKEWELWSENSNSMRDRDLLELNQVKAVFYTESGVTFTVTGKKGIVQLKTKNMRVEGEVITRSSNGYVFRTNNLDYNSQDRLLTTEAEVNMIGPKDASGHSLKLAGSGMKANMQLASIEILRDVKAEKSLEHSRRVLIKSNQSYFNGQDRMARFMGDVILDMDSMRITGPEAKFFYDSKKDLMKSVEFSGGAKVSDTDKWATAQNLKVDFTSNKFVFKGAPRVVQNNDELRGEEIVFLDGGKRVQVLRARAKVDEKRLEKVN